jgi:hypothetical protein
MVYFYPFKKARVNLGNFVAKSVLRRMTFSKLSIFTGGTPGSGG